MNPFRRLIRRWSRPDHRGQSLVEFALTLPLLLLIVMGTVDLGRAYFRVENLTNAVKEGAFFGARAPTCDTNLNPGCPDPRNVQFRVSQELDNVAFTGFTARCFAPGTTDFTTPGKALVDCEDGDLYYVKATVPFDLITPILADLIGSTLNLTSAATSVVLTDFDTTGDIIIPTPGPTPTLPPGSCTRSRLYEWHEDQPGAGGVDHCRRIHHNRDDRRPERAGDHVAEPPGGLRGLVRDHDHYRQQRAAGDCHAECFTIALADTISHASRDPGWTPTPTPSPSPTATPQANCTVPQLVKSPTISITQAQSVWATAGFQAANFSAVRPPNSDYNVASQSLAAGLGATVPDDHDPGGQLMRGLLHRLRRRDRGQALVEFGLVLPILLLLIFGLVDLGRAVYAQNALSEAARDGCAVGIGPSSCRERHPRDRGLHRIADRFDSGRHRNRGMHNDQHPRLLSERRPQGEGRNRHGNDHAGAGPNHERSRPESASPRVYF